MKLIMTMLVRNEDDILRENLEYHLHSGVDHFIITDHHSEDNTVNILNEYKNKGVLTFREEMSPEHHQAKWVSEMALTAFKEYNADWIINNDADEFWVTTDHDLKKFFENVDNNIWKLHINRYDFFYRPFKQGKFFEIMLFREVIRKWTKACHRAGNDVEVEVGNHNAYSRSFAEQGFNEKNINEHLKIFHYPIRDIKKYEKKMIQGFHSISITPGISDELFWHWRQAFQSIKENKFEEYIKKHAVASDQINEKIKNGELKYDTTLQKFFLTKIYAPM